MFSLGILALMVSLYVYFVGKIVFDVVARRGAETAIESTQGSVSSLEIAYLKQIQDLDADGIASSIGLSESHDTLYVSRLASGTATLGMANEY